MGRTFLFWRPCACVIHMASPLHNQEAHSQQPLFSEIWELIQQRFGIQPCLFGNQKLCMLCWGDVMLSTAGTGMGKTLTFWIPLLFCTGGIQIVITPLNLLGKQNAQALAKAIWAIAINSETASHVNIAVSDSLLQDWPQRGLLLVAGYPGIPVLIISHEQVMKPDSGFEKLLKDPLFNTQFISIIIDEAHCICDWGNFRPE